MQYDEAEASFREALKLEEYEDDAMAGAARDAANYARFMEEGMEHLMAGRYDEAEASYWKALNLKGYDEDAYKSISMLLQSRNADVNTRILEEEKKENRKLTEEEKNNYKKDIYLDTIRLHQLKQKHLEKTTENSGTP